MQKDRIRSAKDGSYPDGSPPLKNPYFTILVLDSDYRVDSALADFLRNEGYPILLAASAAEALEKTRSFEPDLILLDCELRGLAGGSLLPELLVEHPTASVVLLASRPSAASVVDAMNLGATDFFERPLDLKRLKASIERQKEYFGKRYPE
jgi:two-component system, NtrC family, response regulator AtoC